MTTGRYPIVVCNKLSFHIILTKFFFRRKSVLSVELVQVNHQSYKRYSVWPNWTESFRLMASKLTRWVCMTYAIKFPSFHKIRYCFPEHFDSIWIHSTKELTNNYGARYLRYAILLSASLRHNNGHYKFRLS